MIRRLLPVLTITSALLLVAPSTRAQGSDTCGTAQVITGTGMFAFDSTLATTDGLPDNLCLAFGSSQIYNDLWWSWTAPLSDSFKVDTCGQTALDTKIAIYDGSCAGAVIACNDDTCNLQSSVNFPATGGNTYIIRLGSFAAAAHGTGTFNVTQIVPPAIQRTLVNPANGHTYHQLESASWTLAEATAVSLGGHLATIDDQAEHDWCTANFHNYLGTDIDLWIGMNDVAVEGTFVWASGAPVAYTNWDTGEPNNANGNEDYGAMRKNNPLAFWNDLTNDPTGFHAGPHGLVEIDTAPPLSSFCAGDGLDPNVTTPCPCSNFGAAGHGCANSVQSAGGSLVASGTPNPDTIVLSGSSMPATVAVIYLQGDGDDDAVFGDGVRCAGGTLIRLRTKVNVGGASQFPEAGDPSVSTRGQVTPGSGVMRRYQAYYRNSAAGFCPPETFNVTNGYRITW